VQEVVASNPAGGIMFSFIDILLHTPFKAQPCIDMAYSLFSDYFTLTLYAICFKYISKNLNNEIYRPCQGTQS